MIFRQLFLHDMHQWEAARPLSLTNRAPRAKRSAQALAARVLNAGSDRCRTAEKGTGSRNGQARKTVGTEE